MVEIADDATEGLDDGTGPIVSAVELLGLAAGADDRMTSVSSASLTSSSSAKTSSWYRNMSLRT